MKCVLFVLLYLTGEISASQVQSDDGMREGVSLVDGHGVGDTISRVKHTAGGPTGGVQGQDGLDGDVHGGTVECLKHDLCHLFSVGLGVQGSLCQQHRVFLRSHSQLIVEGMVPDLLHVVPVGDDSVFDGVFQREDTSLALGLITHVRVLLSHAHHHTLTTPNLSTQSYQHCIARPHFLVSLQTTAHCLKSNFSSKFISIPCYMQGSTVICSLFKFLEL